MTTDSAGISRRHALAGAATVGVGLPLLAACGGDSGATTAADSSPTTGPLGATADIPVGGGAVFADQKVVVTQPTAGDFKGFSATCTHQGCVVANVTETINCPCHGSKFSIEDGSVQAGPATRSLPEVTLKVDGDQVSIG